MRHTPRLVLFLTLLPAVTAGAEPAATISGTVVDSGDRPVADAEVLLSDGPMVDVRMERVYRNRPLPTQVIARTATSGDGTFSIDLKEESQESYWARTWLVLWVHRPGSALTTYLVGRDWPINAAPIKVRLAEAQVLLIHVATPDDSPLKDARVSVEQVDDIRVPRELARRLASNSDSAGRVVLRDVAPSSVDLVRIETESYGVQWTGLRGGGKITLLPVGRIQGRLTADDPRAIAMVPIRLASWLAEGDDSAGGGLAEVVSGADGRFEVPAIAAGALSVNVDAHAELPFRSQAIINRPLKEATTTDLSIRLEHAVRVEGVVRDRQSGEPLADAAICFHQQSPYKLPRSDKEGRYRDLLLPGSASPSPWRMPRGYYFPHYTLDTQPVPEGAAQVELKPLLLARGASLRGRVVDAAGQPVAGAEIDARWELTSGGNSAAHAWGDRDGEFVLDGVAPLAQIELSAWSVHGTTAGGTSVPPGTIEPIELVSSAVNGVRLEGRVVDTLSNSVGGATVRIRYQRPGPGGQAEDDGYACFEGRQRLATDAEGRFRTPMGLVAGRQYRAEVAVAGRLPAMTPFTRKTTSFGDIVLREVPALLAIDGRVVDRRGKTVVGVRVFQTGDGPRRTEATTDQHGHFHLDGVYAGPVFLLVSGKAYPLQGFAFDGDGPAKLTINTEEEPAVRQLKTLAEPLSLAQRREIGLRLVEPMLPALKQGGLQTEKVWLLSTLAALDPNRSAECADLPIFKQAGSNFGDEVRYQTALTLLPEDEADALALGESIGTAHHRGRLYLAACDRLPKVDRGRQAELLAAALLHARAETDVGQRVELMGQIAERWLDLGERDRGTSLLREAQALAEGLPAPSEAADRAHDLSAHMRAFFAGSLARIDGPAAIKLSTGFPAGFADRYRMVVARGLAAHDAAAAERLLDELDYSTSRDSQEAVGVLHRMAGIDLERAARLARKCDGDNVRGYALGIVAHGGLRRDAARTAALLDEAYSLLEQASLDGVGATDISAHPAVLAAALLPVVEHIAPTLVDRYFWRTMAMRSPHPMRLPEQHSGAVVPGALSIFISRYDRAAARMLARPVAAEIGTLASDDDYWTSKVAWASLAVIDAACAISLIETLPEPPALDLRAVKNLARRHVADALAPSTDGWWHKLYKQGPRLRDPDARDDER